MTRQKELLPCSCGSAVGLLPIRASKKEAQWQAWCQRCGRRGPVAFTEEIAIKLWNNDRTKPAEDERVKKVANKIVKAWLWHTPEHDQERARINIVQIVTSELSLLPVRPAQTFQGAPETEASRIDPEERLCVACGKPSWAHSCNRPPLGVQPAQNASSIRECLIYARTELATHVQWWEQDGRSATTDSSARVFESRARQAKDMIADIDHVLGGATYPTVQPAPIDFSCRVCGVQCAIAPDPPARAVCPEHCEDHDYEYQQSERGTYCNHCGQQAPEDLYDD